VCADCSSRNVGERSGAQGVGVRAIVFGGKDASVSGTVVQRLWTVVSSTESSPFPVFFHGAAAPQWARGSSLSRLHDHTQTLHTR
jgi:hypothetical protein